MTAPTVAAPPRHELLGRIPLFAALDRRQLEQLAALAAERLYQRGELVCREGDEGDAFYVVLHGELEVTTGGGGDGGDAGEVRGYLGQGEFFGEMSLLLGGRRSATVRARRRSVLLVLDRHSFDVHCRNDPKVLGYMSQVLCRRLSEAYRGGSGRPATLVIGVVTEPGLKGSSLVASSLVRLLGELTDRPAVHVRANGGAAASPAGDVRTTLRESRDGAAEADLALPQTADRRQLGERLSQAVLELGDTFSFLVLDLGPAGDELRAAVREVCDHLVQIVEHLDQAVPGDATLRVHPVLDLYNPGSRRPAISDGRPFVLPVDAGLVGLAAVEGGERLRQPAGSAVATPLYRLARSILDATVGVALGGGAAFGLAHIGVLRVLEREGVPVDVIAGCSIGSIVALAYAAGVDPDEMAALAGRCTSRQQVLAGMDFTLARPGLMGGDRLLELFAPMVAATPTFDDLERPARAVATDLETGETVVLGDGRLDAAVRASCSVPMLWSPVRSRGRVLVDGGVADPVPVDVVRQMGADVTIAVTVVPPLKQGVETGFQRFFRQLEWLQPSRYFAAGRELPNTLDTVMNSMQILQYELGRFTALKADVQIHPELSDFTWSEFHRADALIAEGEAAAERVVADVRRLLDEKLGRQEGGRAQVVEALVEPADAVTMETG